jgi:ubiquinone/menaquinone biosynthesis C-methylase UbiE
VLVTWTLCTIPEPAAALAEMHRVLRPGGSLHFVEHGHSPDAEVARWQARLNPIQGRLFGGCHLDRPIDDLVTDAGFVTTNLQRYYAPGPKAFSYFYEGIATR